LTERSLDVGRRLRQSAQKLGERATVRVDPLEAEAER
jgi:hypothetical protein